MLILAASLPGSLLIWTSAILRLVWNKESNFINAFNNFLWYYEFIKCITTSKCGIKPELITNNCKNTYVLSIIYDRWQTSFIIDLLVLFLIFSPKYYFTNLSGALKSLELRREVNISRDLRCKGNCDELSIKIIKIAIFFSPVSIKYIN